MIQIITNNKCSRCNTADSGKTILMEIPASILLKLNELFHDGKESEKNELSNIEIPIPIWLCELLYKASQKIPIEDIGKLIGWFLCHPIQYSALYGRMAQIDIFSNFFHIFFANFFFFFLG
jgi:hypothetical protein